MFEGLFQPMHLLVHLGNCPVGTVLTGEGPGGGVTPIVERCGTVSGVGLNGGVNGE
jgi:hypothetical protein